MLTHGDWHDFTVSILEYQEIMKIYRDHPYGLNVVISYHHIILYYTAKEMNFSKYRHIGGTAYCP